MKRVWLILAAFIGLMAGAAPASADIQYTLNCSGDPCTGSAATNNYGTVTLKQLGSGLGAHVQVTVALVAGNVFLSTGGHSGFTWNLAGTNILTSVSVTSANASLFAVQPFNTFATPYGNSPFGNFEYAISNVNTNGNGGIAGPLVFDIQRLGGLVLTDTLFSPNAGGYFFAADIGRACTFSNGKWECGNRTGVVGSNVRIPEPMTVSLTVVAGLALAMLQRRRKLVRA